MKKQKLIIFSLFFLNFIASCANQPVNLNPTINPPNPSVTRGPVSTPSPTVSPLPNYKFPDNIGEMVLLKDNYSGSGSINSFLDENGNGIIVWSGFGIKVKDFIPVDDLFTIDNDFGKSSIYLNNKGDGLIIWSSGLSRGSSGEAFPVTLYGRKMKAYLPIEEKFIISEEKEINHQLSLDESGNGLISFNTGKGEIKILEVDNFTPTNYLSSLKVSELNTSNFHINNNGNGIVTWFDTTNSDLYLNKVDNFKLITDKIKLNETAGYRTGAKIELDNNGNGFVVWSDSKSNLILKIIQNYNPKGNELKVAENINSSYQIKINKDGNGILVWKKNINGSDIYANKIQNFNVSGETINMTNKSGIDRYSFQMDLNNFGDGILVWVQFEGSSGTNFNTDIVARLISNYQPK